MRKTLTVLRRPGAGPARREELRLPAGWEATLLRSSPHLRPLAEGDLPAPRSIPLPEGRSVIVVNDARRPTPTPWLLERLDIDWERGGATVVVATGSHPPPGEEELREIFGAFTEAVRPRLVVHSAGGDGLLHVGRTGRGTPIEVNGCLEGAASVFCLGSVEPHYFAGWTGGRKSLVPGLCSLETMRLNHRLALDAAGPGVLEGNAVHLDLTEGAAMVRGLLRRGGGLHALNVVVGDGGFYGCTFSALDGAVERLAPRAREVFGRRLERAFPVILCLVDHPLDSDLYQALKAFENWKSAVAPGGTLILAAGCRSGMGPPVFRQFLQEPPPLELLLERTSRDYRLGDHKLVGLLRYRESGRNLIVLSEGLRIGGGFPLDVSASLVDALGESSRALPAPTREVLVVEDAGHLYPLPALPR